MKLLGSYKMKTRFGTMIWTKDNHLELLSCLYTMDFVSDTLTPQSFWVENGHWDGEYHAGSVYCEYTKRLSKETWTATPLYKEDFKGIDLNDYNDVITKFEEIFNEIT